MSKKQFLSSSLILSVLLCLTSCGSNETADTAKPVEATAAEETLPAEAQPIQTADEKVSYGIGYEMAKGYGNDLVLKLDRDLLVQGIDDALSGKEMLITQEEAQAAARELQGRLEEKRAADALVAKEEASSYFEANKAKEGIVTTDSGLQYEILVKGDSEQSPVATDSVKVHYHGTLTDGTVFDSSVNRGEPISFPLNGVIKGWTEGLQLMSIGDKFRFHIPSELGYGARATGSIPANSTLIFDVELLGINEG
ncbi:FKBP-type peptidyl-prolyl cis-trans isomerase [Puniceicoccaceae bacterium K14]|nr:FKBP-type peptidyl-prolyl cis-trans isomerase [Puniceicoccaceae bacterium K14]